MVLRQGCILGGVSHSRSLSRDLRQGGHIQKGTPGGWARDEVLCLGGVTQHHGGEPLGQRPLKSSSNLGFFCLCFVFGRTVLTCGIDLVLLLTGYETLDKSLPHPRLRFSTCKVGTTEQT